MTRLLFPPSKSQYSCKQMTMRRSPRARTDLEWTLTPQFSFPGSQRRGPCPVATAAARPTGHWLQGGRYLKNAPFSSASPDWATSDGLGPRTKKPARQQRRQISIQWYQMEGKENREKNWGLIILWKQRRTIEDQTLDKTQQLHRPALHAPSSHWASPRLAYSFGAVQSVPV